MDRQNVTAPTYEHKKLCGSEVVDFGDGNNWTRKEVDDSKLFEFGYTDCPFCNEVVPDHGNGGHLRCLDCGAERDSESGDWDESSDK